MRIQLSKLIPIALLVAIVSGCSQSPPPAPALPQVKGTVKVLNKKGEPLQLEDGIIQFHPADGTGDASKKIWAPVGEGEFQIMTVEGTEKTYGAPEGDYIVTVVGNPENRDNIPGRMYTVPAKYGNPKTSDLKAHVESDDNSFEFTLSN